MTWGTDPGPQVLTGVWFRPRLPTRWAWGSDSSALIWETRSPGLPGLLLLLGLASSLSHFLDLTSTSVKNLPPALTVFKHPANFS